MMIPPLEGKLKQEDFFIYSACDTKYFEEFGKIFINSVLKNTSSGLHIHIFNPSPEQIDFCTKHPRISVSHERIIEENFINMARYWEKEPNNDLEKIRLERIKTAMVKGNDKTIIERLQKTYYACARFIRMKELIKPGHKFLAVDVDAVVRAEIPKLSQNYDYYMFKIIGKKARVLAGGLYSNGSDPENRFINEYSDALSNNVLNDYLYWSLDQDLLDLIVPKYKIGDLPISLIDWDMKPNSVIWTAKGSRKNLKTFIDEQTKYNVL